MVLSESMQFNQNTSDNLNPADSVVPILKKSDETIRLIEKSSILSTNTIGHSFVLGHTTNGVLGVANGVDGQQIVLGEAGRSGLVVLYVVNPNNTFKEMFKTTTFKDTSSPNTAYWDTTNFKLVMANSNDQTLIYNTVATSSSIFLNLQTITKATIYATETKFGNDRILYYLSADGGSHWEECTLGTEHIFTTTGQDLRVRIVFVGIGASSTYIENLETSYVVS